MRIEVPGISAEAELIEEEVRFGDLKSVAEGADASEVSRLLESGSAVRIGASTVHRLLLRDLTPEQKNAFKMFVESWERRTFDYRAHGDGVEYQGEGTIVGSGVKFRPQNDGAWTMEMELRLGRLVFTLRSGKGKAKATRS